MIQIDMKMPSRCYYCPFAKDKKTNDYGSFCECAALGNHETINLLEHSRHSNCPLIEQESCEDCISRQAAIDALREAENHAFNSYYKGLIAAHKIIADLPSVTPQPKTGHWIVNKKVDTAYDISGYKSWAISYACEHCGFIHQAIENHGVYSYCPNCGARMVELQESEVQDADSD